MATTPSLTPKTIKAEYDQRLAADKALEARLAKLEAAAAPVPTPVPPTTPPVIPPPADAIPVPPSIDATGVTVVGPALQAFIDSVPGGKTIIAPGKYNLGANGLKHYSRGVPVIHGVGSGEFRVVGGASSVMTYLGCTSAILRGLSILGDNLAGGTRDAYLPALEEGHGLRLRGTSGIETDHVLIDQVHSDGIFFDSFATYDRWCSDANIHDTTIRRNGRQGITVNAARRVRGARITLDQIAMNPIDFEPDDPLEGAQDVILDVAIGSYGLDKTYEAWAVAITGAGGDIMQDITISATIAGNVGGYLGRVLGANLAVFAPRGAGRPRRKRISFVDLSSTTVGDGRTSSGALQAFAGVDGLTLTRVDKRVFAGADRIISPDCTLVAVS